MCVGGGGESRSGGTERKGTRSCETNSLALRGEPEQQQQVPQVNSTHVDLKTAPSEASVRSQKASGGESQKAGTARSFPSSPPRTRFGYAKGEALP